MQYRGLSHYHRIRPHLFLLWTAYIANAAVIHVQSAFFVLSSPSHSGSQALCGPGHVYLSLSGDDGSSQLSLYTGVLGPYSGQHITTRSQVGFVQRAGNDVDFYLASTKANQTGGNRIYDDAALEIGSLGGGQACAATVQFAAFCDSALSDADAAEMLAYLARTYGV